MSGFYSDGKWQPSAVGIASGEYADTRYSEPQVTTDNTQTLVNALAEIEKLKGLLATDSTSTLNDAMHEIERLQNFESDAKRLALELECLLMSCDLPAATKWWDSAHEALELHRKTIGQYYGEKL